jgi:protein TonB
MFDDFRPSANAGEARRRMGGSMAVAVAVYVLLAVLIIGGTTAATSNVVEHMTQVDFAPPPPPPPPPPEPIAAAQPVAQTRPKVKRKELKAPDKVPDAKPKESDAPLAEAGPTGPVDGFLNGVEGGTGTKAAKAVAPAPPPKPEPLIQPVLLPTGNQAPGYSASAKRKEIEGVVVVGFDVLENGTVANVAIVSGPDELRENVLKTVKTWRFQPAKKAGKPVRIHLTKSIRFRLTDA